MNFKNFFSFSGRISRRDYWVEYAISLVTMGLLAPVVQFGGKPGAFVGLVGYLALLVAVVSVHTRRLHDTDRSGWYQLRWIGAMAALALLAVFFGLKGMVDIKALWVAGGCGLGILAVAVHSFYVLGIQAGERAINSYGEPDSSPMFPY